MRVFLSGVGFRPTWRGGWGEGKGKLGAARSAADWRSINMICLLQQAALLLVFGVIRNELPKAELDTEALHQIAVILGIEYRNLLGCQYVSGATVAADPLHEIILSSYSGNKDS